MFFEIIEHHFAHAGHKCIVHECETVHECTRASPNGSVDLFGTQYGGEGNEPSRNSLRGDQNVGVYVEMIAREPLPRSSKAGHHLVHDQKHAIFPANFLNYLEISFWRDKYPSRGAYDWFDNERRDTRGATFLNCLLEFVGACGGALRRAATMWATIGRISTKGGEGNKIGLLDGSERGLPAHRKSAECGAVVAWPRIDDLISPLPPRIMVVLPRELERGFHRIRTSRNEIDLSEPLWRDIAEFAGIRLHMWSGELGTVEKAYFLGEVCDAPRERFVAMSYCGNECASYRVEISLSLLVIEVDAFSVRNDGVPIVEASVKHIARGAVKRRFHTSVCMDGTLIPFFCETFCRLIPRVLHSAIMAWKLAVLTSHPIQYQAPLFRRMSTAPGVDLTVYFCWNFGVEQSFDKDFGIAIKWDIPLLEGYRHAFLKNYSPRPSSGFWGQVNPAIVTELFKHKYDAVLIYGWNSLTNWLAFAAMIVTGTPVLIRGENPFNQELLKGRLKLSVKKLVLGWLFKRIKAFLYIGEENRKFYRYYDVPEERLFFAPYAVDNERFIKEADTLSGKRDHVRASLGIARGAFTVLFMGKLTSKKQPDVLLKTFEAMKKKGGDAHLFFVGDGELRPKLEEYARSHGVADVHFEGFKNQTELARYYAAADVLVLPSGAGETWGLAVNEAMCFSLPVVVSDAVGCAPDLVRNNENGFVVPLGDVSAFAEKLEMIARDPTWKKRLGAASRRIIGHYNYQEDVRGILAALRYIT